MSGNEGAAVLCHREEKALSLLREAGFVVPDGATKNFFAGFPGEPPELLMDLVELVIVARKVYITDKANEARVDKAGDDLYRMRERLRAAGVDWEWLNGLIGKIKKLTPDYLLREPERKTDRE